jgi:hypothetical protein
VYDVEEYELYLERCLIDRVEKIAWASHTNEYTNSVIRYSTCSSALVRLTSVYWLMDLIFTWDILFFYRFLIDSMNSRFDILTYSGFSQSYERVKSLLKRICISLIYRQTCFRYPIRMIINELCISTTNRMNVCNYELHK